MVFARTPGSSGTAKNPYVTSVSHPQPFPTTRLGKEQKAAPVSDFAELGLGEQLLRAVVDAGYEEPTPIQARAIPHAMQGGDLFGCAQTGTGKTAAFVLPTLHRLLEKGRASARRKIRALVLSPTRELATQIGEGFKTLGRHTDITQAVVFGGVGQGPQVEALRRGIDVLVAAPGRLVDLMDQGLVDLSSVEVLILDEADRMLDQGFLPAVKRILTKVPEQRQTLLFSATMPAELEPLARRMLKNPERIEVAKVASTPDQVTEELYRVEQAEKRFLLSHLLGDPSITRVVVFTRTKHGADRVARHLERGSVRVGAIHGNKSQGARERALGGFKDGSLRVLVATDVAARGIDIDGVSHVINFDLPMDAEAYVHRIGRTARAGATGKAMSFCAEEDGPKLARIERLIRRPVPVVNLPASLLAKLRSAAGAVAQARPAQASNRPAQGRGEQGRPAQGRGEQGRPAQGRGEQGRPSQGRPAQGRGEQGRPSQGRPAQGRPGQTPGRAAEASQRRPEQGRPAQPQQDRPAQPQQGRPAQGHPGRGSAMPRQRGDAQRRNSP